MAQSSTDLGPYGAKELLGASFEMTMPPMPVRWVADIGAVAVSVANVAVVPAADVAGSTPGLWVPMAARAAQSQA